MKLRHACVALVPLVLGACGSSRPVYFGHQGSTDGMPGYVDGQKTNPNIKLGKPYRVAGRTYIPKYEPDYDETGMASWYGPGFHGGKTANGEQFDKYDFTAAHTTLPLPSIVKVTNVKNGKYVYVRVNDRGPYADNRIIDLSKAAAEQIDLVRQGVAKVRVQYMQAPTEKLVAMMNDGREPSSIDIAHEIIRPEDTQFASNTKGKKDWWQYVNPVPSANAEEPTDNAAVIDSVQAGDVRPPQPPPAPPMLRNQPDAADLFDPVENMVPPDPIIVQPTEIVAPANIPPGANAPPSVRAMAITAPVKSGTNKPMLKPGIVTPQPAYYVQLGSFSVQANAEAVRSKFSGPTVIEPIVGSSGATFYRVRMGPFASAEQAEAAMGKARSGGIGDARVIKP